MPFSVPSGHRTFSVPSGHRTFSVPSGHFSVPLPVSRLPVLIERWKVLLTVIGMPSGLCGGWSSLCWLTSRFILGRGLARRFIFVSGLASRFEFGGWLPRWSRSDTSDIAHY